jgi:hypothetical protein
MEKIQYSVQISGKLWQAEQQLTEPTADGT